MLIWVLAALDFLVLTTITLTHFEIIFSPYLIFLSIGFLVLKGIIFFPEKMSMVDLIFAFYLLLLFFGVSSTLFFYLAAAWFLYKIIFTIAS